MRYGPWGWHKENISEHQRERGGKCPKELVHFLKYMEQSNDEYVSRLTEESIIRLHEKVTELKTWRKLEARYMTVEEWMKDRESRVREETEQEARQEDIFAFLEEYGAIPEHIRKAVLAQEDLTVLKRWLKLAARAESVERFEKEM